LHRITCRSKGTGESAEGLSAQCGFALLRPTVATPLCRSEAEIGLMHKHAEAVIYPTRAERVMQEETA
jgi:hypothetical protein